MRSKLAQNELIMGYKPRIFVMPRIWYEDCMIADHGNQTKGRYHQIVPRFMETSENDLRCPRHSYISICRGCNQEKAWRKRI